MTRIVETTLDIRFSADGDTYAVADCNVAGDVAAQAELLAFAHVSARTVQLVGAERGLALLQALALRDGVPLGPKPGRSAASSRVVARFLGARGQPRMFFTMKQRSSRSSPFTDTVGLAAASLEGAFAALLRRGSGDETRRRRLVTTAQLVGRFAADGVVHPQSEFDVALVAADVAWRSDASPEHVELECPACGSQGTSERRLWPSERDTLAACTACGSGLWLRSGEPVRQLDQGVWRSMEGLRDSVADDVVAARRREPRSQHPDDKTAQLFSQLKLVFAENRWPFAEVRDEPVLVSDLSGVWGTWKFYAQVAADHDAVLFYSICPLRVPEDARQEAAQFLARANYGLATGNFELDFDDGEIRYKTVLLVDGDLSPSGVKRAVRANGVAMETYLPGIGAVIAGTPALPALERRVGA